MNRSNWAVTLSILGISLLGGLLPAGAQSDVPPPEMLDAIFPALRHKVAPKPPPKVLISRVSNQPQNPACDLTPLRLTETRGDDMRVFELLGLPTSDQDPQPTTLLIRLQRLTVDADGSKRTYHPEDPFGRGVCESRTPTSSQVGNICALDNLGNANIRVFDGSKRIPLFNKEGADQAVEPNLDFKRLWTELWSHIADRQQHWVDLDALFGADASENLHLYYLRQSNTAVIFDSDIIPFKDGFPCQYGEGNRNEYFVAATTPVPGIKRKSDGDACSTSSYLDSSQVPFFVLPGGVFKNLNVGDIAVAAARINDEVRLVFGIVGDIGPEGQIGEGSIAALLQLREIATQPMNSLELSSLDIKVQNNPDPIDSLALLVMGGTALKLGGDYSASNIRNVGRAALAEWAGNRPARLRACIDAAIANPLEGFEHSVRN